MTTFRGLQSGLEKQDLAGTETRRRENIRFTFGGGYEELREH